LANVVTVIFEPMGRVVSISFGTTIFQAAIKAGIGIRSECGGKGLCGKCRVMVKNTEALSGCARMERWTDLSSGSFDGCRGNESWYGGAST
jgi:uncharacterized 2Fe-2S/4Fe-4S cluster protein (DUF4445 family)